MVAKESSRTTATAEETEELEDVSGLPLRWLL